MIVDLQKFSRNKKELWEEFENILNSLEKNPFPRMNVEGVKRFHYLYRAVSADLVKIATFSADPGLKEYLENLVSRAYAEVYGNGKIRKKPSLSQFFFGKFPAVFRKHLRFFQIALAVMLAGCLFGGGATVLDTEAKSILMPFPHLQTDPSERVKMEESETPDLVGSQKASFSSYLMTHNIRVTIFVLALGMTWGIGTVAVLFANGVMLGAVIADYVFSGETLFLFGWLLPHGAVEIPAVLVGGQAGLLIASGLIGKGRSPRLGERMREISSDLATLVFGATALLLWAGIIEGFFSQYHEPVIPYGIKIGFGMIEIVVLGIYLARAGVAQNRQAN